MFVNVMNKTNINFNDFLIRMDLDFENDLQMQQLPNTRNQNSNEDGYYQQYCRLFLANIALTNQIKELNEQKNHLKYRLSKYQDQQCYSSFERNQKAKRFRRNAHEIERFYKCTIKSCGKSYGSEGSLNQHYKLKHPEIYASLPNVQSVHSQKKSEMKSDTQQSRNDFIHHSNSKLNSILKELGDMKYYNTIKIEELRFDMDEKKQNKQNQSTNISQNVDTKELLSSKKQLLSFIRKDQPATSDDVNKKLKRSSRTIKKRDLNF